MEDFSKYVLLDSIDYTVPGENRGEVYVKGKLLWNVIRANVLTGVLEGYIVGGTLFPRNGVLWEELDLDENGKFLRGIFQVEHLGDMVIVKLDPFGNRVLK